MAKARHLNRCGFLHGAAEHGHGIGVVKEKSVGTEFLHVPADIDHHGNCAQSPEDARHATGVTHVEVDAVFGRNLNVMAPDVDLARQNRHDHGVGALQGLFAVRCGDHPVVPMVEVHKPAHGLVDEAEPLFVDIHESECAVLQVRKGKNVANEAAGETQAAGADKSNFSHCLFSYSCCESRCWL